ncbi:MAG TPA: phospholipid carrier-dependent glycosyltransferase [Gammaproteobacteria bacterium]|nr:phospholipid carrier-dependent glycosyltransferase [Gammaproteobacteria bacterium]
MSIAADVAHGMGGRTRHFVVAMLALFVLLYVAPLPLRPLGSPDEVRYGAIAREMIVSGDWVSPRFNGVRYFEKPVLGYWIEAISLSALGENAFALRLPVVLATALMALVVLLLARRFVSAFAARLATAIFLTTVIVAGVGTFAVLDSFLALFVTIALAAWYAATAEPPGRRRLLFLALCGCACGAAFLVKGFIAWAIPVIVAAPHLALRRQWRTLATFPWLPIAVAVAVTLPWAVLIHLREPDFWHYFFWVEHVQRFAGENAQHPRPAWFYLACLPLIGWPWALFLPAAAAGLRGEPPDDFRQYLILWVVMPFVFFSIAKGKLLTYVLPCFVPLSILLAAGLERYFVKGGRRWFGAAALVMAALFAALLVALVAAQRGVRGSPLYTAAELPQLLAFGTILAVGAASAAFACFSARVPLRLGAIAVAGVASILPLHFVLPQRVVEQVAPAVAVARYASAAPDTVVVADASLFGTAAWVLGRDDIYVVSPGEISYGLSYPEARHRNLDARMLEDLVAANAGRADVLLIVERDTARDLAPHLPANASRAEHGAVVLLRIPRSV